MCVSVCVLPVERIRRHNQRQKLMRTRAESMKPLSRSLRSVQMFFSFFFIHSVETFFHIYFIQLAHFYRSNAATDVLCTLTFSLLHVSFSPAFNHRSLFKWPLRTFLCLRSHVRRQRQLGESSQLIDRRRRCSRRSPRVPCSSTYQRLLQSQCPPS